MPPPGRQEDTLLAVLKTEAVREVLGKPAARQMGPGGTPGWR